MNSKEIFSFHLLNIPLLQVPRFLLAPAYKKGISGLLHSESFFTMRLGESVISAPRYSFREAAFYAWWKDEASLEEFLKPPSSQAFLNGWHVRMRPYRRWGKISEIQNAVIDSTLAVPNRPIVAVTLARLNLLETRRFTKLGKPVEKQVRDHKGQRLALAAMRPPNTFCTFSIWNNEADMIDMVQGRNEQQDGSSHKLAMKERARKDFHREFTTMRFTPFKEVGSWNGKSNLTEV